MKEPRTSRNAPPETFDVTQVIGTVLPTGGELAPDMAAYQLISRHDTPGTYKFPNMYGGDTTVDVAPASHGMEDDDEGK